MIYTQPPRVRRNQNEMDWLIVLTLPSAVSVARRVYAALRRHGWTPALARYAVIDLVAADGQVSTYVGYMRHTNHWED